MLKRFAKLIRTASPHANALTTISTLLLLLKLFVLNRFPAAFFGAYELGILTEAILTSIIASYIFYLVVVHLKEQTDRDILQPYVEKHAKRIIGDCVSQLNGFSEASEVKLTLDELTQQDVENALSKIPPYSQAPLIISPTNQHANWFQYFTYHEKRTKDSIRKLLNQLPFLDVTLVSLITSIDDSPHFTQLNILLEVHVNNSDMTAWASTFFDYCILCRQLNTHLLKYGFTPVEL